MLLCGDITAPRGAATPSVDADAPPIVPCVCARPADDARRRRADVISRHAFVGSLAAHEQ